MLWSTGTIITSTPQNAQNPPVLGKFMVLALIPGKETVPLTLGSSEAVAETQHVFTLPDLDSPHLSDPSTSKEIIFWPQDLQDPIPPALLVYTLLPGWPLEPESAFPSSSSESEVREELTMSFQLYVPSWRPPHPWQHPPLPPWTHWYPMLWDHHHLPWIRPTGHTEDVGSSTPSLRTGSVHESTFIYLLPKGSFQQALKSTGRTRTP